MHIESPSPFRLWRAAALMLLAATVTGASDAGLPDELRGHVSMLAGTIGPRGVHRPEAMKRAADYIATQFTQQGWTVRRHGYVVSGVTCENIEVELRGKTVPDEIVIFGAHYDTVPATPGADDNASGVAALLSLAREFVRGQPERTLRFVAFANEEPAYFQTEMMGSRVYARGCKQRGEAIVAMVSLETVGYFSEEKGSQRYPSVLLKPFFPSRGNFIAFVGNRASKELVARAAKAFKATKMLPCETAALPEALPGIGWSDHWSFWKEGYPAIMVTDTAPYRNPHYHKPGDTVETLDYGKMMLAVLGLRNVVSNLVRAR